MPLTFSNKFKLPIFFFEDKLQDAELLGQKSLISVSHPDFCLFFRRNLQFVFLPRESERAHLSALHSTTIFNTSANLIGEKGVSYFTPHL